MTQSWPPGRSLLVLCSSLALSACVDTAVEMGAKQAAAPSARFVARQGVSPRGAPITLTSLEGAPDGATRKFRDFFASAAQSRDIDTVDAKDAQYRVRGYLSAIPGQGGTRFSYVWDVFDRQGRRAQRLSDEVTLPGAADWGALDDKALAEVAGRGAGDLAAFLTNTPEAIAAATGAGAGMSVAAAQRSAPAPAAAPAQGIAQAQ